MGSARLERLFAGFHEFIEHKRSVRRPARIVAFLAAPTLAGFIHQNIVAATILRRFPGAEVTAFYREDAGARRFVADCNPFFHGEIVAPAEAPMTVPLDWFDVGTVAPVKCPDPAWSERNIGRPDLLLTPKTLSTDAARLADIQDAPPALRLSEAYAERQDALLGAVGLPATAWYACIDPEGLGADGVTALIRHVEDDLGGRAVLVGQPSAPPVADASRAVDLRGHPMGFPAQIMALSGARFVVAGGDWPAAMASALRVPVAVCRVPSHETLAWNRDDMVLISGPGGGLSHASAIEAADHLFRRSAGVSGHRGPAEDISVPAEDALSLPLALRAETALVFRAFVGHSEA